MQYKTLAMMLLLGMALIVNLSARGDNEPLSGSIIPGEKLFGVPWDCTTERLIAHVGNPDALIILPDNKKMFIYGNKTLICFANDKLYQISLGYNWLPAEISKMFSPQKLDDIKWGIAGVIHEGAKFKDIESKFGKSLYKTDEPDNFSIKINHCAVSLIFSYGTSDLSGCVVHTPENDGKYQLNNQPYAQERAINDNVIFSIPYGAGQDHIVKQWGTPQGKFRFANHRTGLLYGKYILILEQEKLCGIYIDNRNNALPFFSFAQATSALPEWNINGINKHSSLKELREKFSKELKTDTPDKMFFSTEKLNIAMGIARPQETISYILIKQKPRE